MYWIGYLKKDTKQKAILGIVLLIVIILCAVYVQLNSTNTTNKYNDININSEQLNIFFFNVGQADSTLITYEDKVILIDAEKEVESKLLKAGILEDIDGTIWLTSDGIKNTVTILNKINLDGANQLGMRVYFKYALFLIFISDSNHIG